MNEDACIHHCPHAKMLRNHKKRIVVPELLNASELQITWLLRCSDMIRLPFIV